MRDPVLQAAPCGSTGATSTSTATASGPGTVSTAARPSADGPWQQHRSAPSGQALHAAQQQQQHAGRTAAAAAAPSGSVHVGLSAAAQTPWVLRRASDAVTAAAGSSIPARQPVLVGAGVKQEVLDPTGQAGWLHPAAPDDAAASAAAPASALPKPAPWRVHFSQVQEDPLVGAMLAAAADLQQARPWRMRRGSTVPEGEGEGEAEGALGPLPLRLPHPADGMEHAEGGTNVDDDVGDGGGGAHQRFGQLAPPAWRIHHDQGASPLPGQPAAAALAGPPAPLRLAGRGPSEPPAAHAVHPTAAAACSADSVAAWSAPAGQQQQQGAEGGRREVRAAPRPAAGVYGGNPADLARPDNPLLEALASPSSSQGSYGFAQLDHRGASAVSTVAAAEPGPGRQRPAPAPPQQQQQQPYRPEPTSPWGQLPLTQLVEGLREAREGLGAAPAEGASPAWRGRSGGPGGSRRADSGALPSPPPPGSLSPSRRTSLEERRQERKHRAQQQSPQPAAGPGGAYLDGAAAGPAHGQDSWASWRATAAAAAGGRGEAFRSPGVLAAAGAAGKVTHHASPATRQQTSWNGTPGAEGSTPGELRCRAHCRGCRDKLLQRSGSAISRAARSLHRALTPHPRDPAKRALHDGPEPRCVLLLLWVVRPSALCWLQGAACWPTAA